MTGRSALRLRLLAFALLLAAALLPGHATVVRGDAITTVPSAEEAVITLKSFVLTAADLPPGYSPAPARVDTPSIDALLLDKPVNVQRNNLDGLVRDGQVVWTSQGLAPAGSPGVPEAIFFAYVMTDAARARARTLPDLSAATTARYDLLPDQLSLGDVSRSWHYAATPASGDSIGGYLTRWQHGSLSFSVSTAWPYGQEKLPDAAALAQAVERKIAAAGVAVPESGTVAPPATEAARFNAGAALRTLALDGVPGINGAPDFRNTASGFLHPAGFVFTSRNPQTTLAQYDTRMQLLMGIDQVFYTPAGTAGPRLRLFAFLTAGSDGALAGIAIQHPMADDEIAPPLAVGDTTVAYRQTLTTGASAGMDFVDVYWVHGPTLLNVDLLGPADLLTNDFITGFINQVEAAYQASALTGRR